MAILGALGDLVLALSADTSKFTSDLGKAHRATEKFIKEVSYSLNRLAGALAGLGGSAGLGALIKSQIDAADAAGKMAQRIGTTTEALSAYLVAARLSNVSNEQLEVGFRALAKNQADFIRGTGEARDAFEALGITTEQVQKANGDTAKIFDLVAGKLAGYADGANKTAIATAILGKSGSQLIPLINSLEETRSKAEELGLVFDSVTAKDAERFNDTMAEIGLVVKAIGLSIARDLLQTLQAIAEEFLKTAKGAQEFNIAGTVAKTVLQTLAVVGSDVAFVFKMIGGEIGVWAAQLAALARGDFKGFSIISEEWKRDAAQARKDLDEFQARVLGLSTATTSTAAAITKVGEVTKQQAPAIRSHVDDIKKAKEAYDEFRKAIMRVHDDALAAAEADQEIERISRAARDAQTDIDEMIEKARTNPRQGDDEGGLPSGMGAEESEAHKQKMRELRQVILSEEEQENIAHKERMLELQYEFTDKELEALGGRQEIEQQMESEHQARLLDIRAKGSGNILRMMEAFRRQDYSSAMDYLTSMTAGLSHHSRKMFELNKVLATANVIMKGIEAVQAAYAWGNQIGGPYFGAAMAAIAASFSLAQLSAIQSTQFGSGAAPSIAGTTAATPVSPVLSETPARSNQTTIINLQGDDSLLSTRQVRQLLKQIEESTRGGGRVVVA